MVRFLAEERRHADGHVAQFSLARTHFGRPVYRVSAYWVDGLLVDTGPRWARDGLRGLLRGRRLEVVVATHHHEDHVGNAGPLERERSVSVAASPAAVALARHAGRLPLYRRHAWGPPDAGHPIAIGRTVSTPRHRFEVVTASGHTPGDVALVEPTEGWAFVGDLLLAETQRATMRGEDLAGTMRALEGILKFEPRWLFTGIRTFGSAIQVLRGRLDFLTQVLQRADAARKTGRTPAAARREILGREGFVRYFSGGEISKRNLIDQAWDCPVHEAAPPSAHGHAPHGRI